MKHLFTFLIIAALFIFPDSVYSQGIYQLWGTTTAGGKDDNGAFFSTKFDGTGQTNFDYFTRTNAGRSWEYNQPVAYNGKFYSLLHYGGIDDAGVISEYDPATNAYTTKVNLYNVGLKESDGALTVFNNKLYGISYSPSTLKTVLFEFNPVNSVVVVKHYFEEATGRGPGQEPTLYNGKLYGTTATGGNNDQGVVYEFDPANGNYTVKHHFTAPLQGSSIAGLTVYGGLLWGVGSSDKIFSFNPATNAVQQRQDLNQFGLLSVYGRMAVLNNKLYGVSSQSGLHDEGFIFEFDPALNTVHIDFNFTATTVQNRLTLLTYNGLLYGAGYFGGANQRGELFSYNPVNNNYTTLKAFSDGDGGSGEGRLLLYNNKMYGWLAKGGYISSTSALFEYNPANNQFVLKTSLGDGELEEPNGQLMYYKHKLYGMAAEGGSLNGGGIYAFDLQTSSFELKVPMSLTNGQIRDQGGLLLYNDVFYGVTNIGGSNGVGTLFKYDPNSNVYTKIFDFGGSAGEYPYGQLVVFNNRIYGTCHQGSTSDKGSIFEFNPFTNVVAARVAFDGSNGANPLCGLTVFHNRIFGVTRIGGANNDGVLFEYQPLPNALVKLADFKFDVTGSDPAGRLAGYDNKLWGVTASSAQGGYAGCIYQYDLATGTLSKKKELELPTGLLHLSGLTMLNHKFYGITNNGGNTNAGVLFEYDPATNNYTAATHLEPSKGKWARRTELAAAPAPAAHGSPNACINSSSVNINAANANRWIPFTDAQGRAIAEINANGNILGNTTVRLFVHDGATRQSAGGTYYLDRNITISTTTAPVTPVSVRLYIRKTEFESLKATAGSGINQPSDLVIYKNNDFCAAEMASTALPLPTTKEDWGFDYVYTAEVSSFSSFYFAKLSGALPVRMLSFTGIMQDAHNKLQWKAACTNNVDFIVERSNDGIHFDSIGIKEAIVADCNHPFDFTDVIPEAISYYRLKLVEDNGSISYSDIVVLERTKAGNLKLSVYPNPVTGNQLTLKLTSDKKQLLKLQLTELSGKIVWNGFINSSIGTSLVPITLPKLAAGMYYLRFADHKNNQVIKLIKQ